MHELTMLFSHNPKICTDQTDRTRLCQFGRCIKSDYLKIFGLILYKLVGRPPRTVDSISWTLNQWWSTSMSSASLTDSISIKDFQFLRCTSLALKPFKRHTSLSFKALSFFASKTCLKGWSMQLQPINTPCMTFQILTPLNRHFSASFTNPS